MTHNGVSREETARVYRELLVEAAGERAEIAVGRWLVCRPLPAKGTTGRWEVCSRNRGTVLGEIRWYNGWRQYVFVPATDTLFNGECLHSIRTFLYDRMAEHKSELLARQWRKDHPEETP